MVVADPGYRAIVRRGRPAGLALMLSAGCQLASQGGGSAGIEPGVADDTSTEDSSSTPVASTSGGGGPTGAEQTGDVTTDDSVSGTTAGDDESGEDTDDTGTGERPLPPPDPFVDVVHLSGLGSSSADYSPTLRADRLEMYFATNRYGEEDIMRATRVSLDQPWGAPALVFGQVSTTDNETNPELSPDGLVLLFSSDRGKAGDYEVYYILRDSLVGMWSLPEPVPTLGSPMQEFSVTAQPDLTTVLFCSDRTPSEGLDVWRVFVDEKGRHSAPEQMLDLSTSAHDCPGNSSDDMTWLALGSDRTGTVGGADLWFAQQTESGEGYWPAHNLTELNTTAAERDPWVSAELEVIYFASDRTGDLEIYQARAAD